MTPYKLMLLGDIGVGKTSLVRRLIDGEFQSDYGATADVDVYTYQIPPADLGAAQDVVLAIWDTDGKFGNKIFKHNFIIGADGAVIVADATRRDSQENSLTLASSFEDSFPGRPVFFIVNKMDLIDDDHPLEMPSDLERSNNLVQTSALTGRNVQMAFHNAAATLARRGW